MIVKEAVKDYQADVALALTRGLRSKQIPLERARKLANMVLEVLDEHMTGDAFFLRIKELATKEDFFQDILQQHMKRYEY